MIEFGDTPVAYRAMFGPNWFSNETGGTEELRIETTSLSKLENRLQNPLTS